uniref:ATP synthase complex subunit 8 n=1 Tax=Eretes sticticus TaxID=107803 RepID=A0A7S8CV10_EREST|nr:ATP synthase F0 subunit 8 [Eretes sticticus]QPC56725.1 ATP synthase F0 subunit 8 [Eretes sticticus]
MPQMAPMNWLFLYILFSFIFILFNFMNYYLFLIKSQNSTSKKIFNKILNWKW